MKLRRSALAARVSRGLGLVLVVLAGLPLGCSYATYPPRIVEGKAFPFEEAKAVEKGDSADEVRAALGAPLEVEAQSGKELWRYYARERKDGVAYILGFIPNRTPHFIWDYELELIIDDGIIQEAVYTETEIK